MLAIKRTARSDILSDVLGQVGLRFNIRHFVDHQYLVALLAGIPVVWMMLAWMLVFHVEHQFSFYLLFSLIVWYPFIEELMFRGIIQGQLSIHGVSGDLLPGISCANAITSSLFVLLHVVMSPGYWPLVLFAPSLVYGYFRERSGSVVPSMLLHGAYNLYVVIGLMLAGSSIA